MIKHIVIWKLKEASPKIQQTQIEEIKKGLEGLVGKIEGLISAKVFTGIGSDGSQILLDSVLENQQALDFYQEHPQHVVQKNIISNYVCSRISFDYHLE